MTESYEVVQTILTERLNEVFVALVKLHICSKLCTDKDSQELEGERGVLFREFLKFLKSSFKKNIFSHRGWVLPPGNALVSRLGDGRTDRCLGLSGHGQCTWRAERMCKSLRKTKADQNWENWQEKIITCVHPLGLVKHCPLCNCPVTPPSL